MRKRMMSIVLIVLAATLSAQTTRKNLRPPSVLRTPGTQQVTTSNPPPPPPPDLSAAAKADVLKSLNVAGPGSLYFKVSPSVSYVAGKGALEFHDAHVVNGIYGSANWLQSKTGLMLIVQGEGGERRYLMDCKVVSMGNEVFKISNVNHTVLQTFASNQNNQSHLLFVVETNDSWLHYFVITGGPN